MENTYARELSWILPKTFKECNVNGTTIRLAMHLHYNSGGGYDNPYYKLEIKNAEGEHYECFNRLTEAVVAFGAVKEAIKKIES